MKKLLLLLSLFLSLIIVSCQKENLLEEIQDIEVNNKIFSETALPLSCFNNVNSENEERFSLNFSENKQVINEAPVVISPPRDQNLIEGQFAAFFLECAPQNDPSLYVEVFCNGRPLLTGIRFNLTFNFGYVILTINQVFPEDSGEYTFRFTNKFGQATSSAKLKVTPRS